MQQHTSLRPDRALHHLDPVPDLLLGEPAVQRPIGVLVIRPQECEARVRVRIEFGSHLGCRSAIIGCCCRHQDGQQQAEGVHHDRPLTTVHLLVAILAALSPALGPLHCLGLDAARTGSGITSGVLPDRLPQGVEPLLPSAVVTPLAEGVVHRARGKQVVGQQVPVTAGTVLVKQRIQDLAHGDGTGTAPRLGRRDERWHDVPLVIRQISRVGFTQSQRLSSVW
jgi:hypothetical protein